MSRPCSNGRSTGLIPHRGGDIPRRLKLKRSAAESDKVASAMTAAIDIFDAPHTNGVDGTTRKPKTSRASSINESGIGPFSRTES